MCNSEPPKPNGDRGTTHSSTSTEVLSIPVTATATSTSGNSLPHSNTTCLLKTAVAPVIAGLTRRLANILFNEGAQRSFILAEMAAKLNLKPTTTQGMALASFGSTNISYQKLRAVTVEIETITGDGIPVSVLVIPL